MNIVDNGIDVSPKDGLRLNPTGIFFLKLYLFLKKNLKKVLITQLISTIRILKGCP